MALAAGTCEPLVDSVGRVVQAANDVEFRLKLAAGFLQEAQEDLALQRWRSCVDNSQLATENAAKAVLALLGPVGRTHNPATLLRKMLASDSRLSPVSGEVERLAECAEFLGPDIHVQSDYGDEAGGQTPWDLFDEDAARQAFGFANEAVGLAQGIVQRTL